jgi:hypothetical protein
MPMLHFKLYIYLDYAEVSVRWSFTFSAYETVYFVLGIKAMPHIQNPFIE